MGGVADGRRDSQSSADMASGLGSGTGEARILLVEEDPKLTDVLVRLLTDESYEVEVATDAQQALRHGLTRAYDVVIMDADLSTMDALDLLVLMRVRGMATLTLLLSALGEPADRVAGLDAGADAYLVKPFDIGELLARVRALRRRHVDTGRRLLVPGGEFDLESRQVTLHDGARVRLSPREFALLVTLASRPRKVFSLDELRVIAFDDRSAEVVGTYVHYLRRKLGAGIVATVRGRGYRLGSVAGRGVR